MPMPFTALRIAPADPSVSAGRTLTLQCYARYVNGTEAPITTGRWSVESGGGSIGITTGTYTARSSAGIARIRVTHPNGQYAYVDLTVTAPMPAPSPTPVPSPVPAPTATALRVGMNGMAGRVGHGPAGARDALRYGEVSFPPQPGSIVEQIALAERQDVVLVLNPSRARSQWAPGGQLSRSLYERNVREFETISALRAATKQKRVLLYVADELNHPGFERTADPADLVWMCQLHKRIWPGAITLVRMGAVTLAEGWNGHPPPAGGWSGLDYGWSQRAGQHNDMTLTAYYADEARKLERVGVGMIPGLNLWAGGIPRDLDGVKACWDYANNGQSNGYIVGTPSPEGIAEGETYACGRLPQSVTRLAASPPWIRRWAQVVSTLTAAPFAPLWAYPDSSRGVAWAAQLIHRPDYVSAIQQGITLGRQRAAFVGLRTPK